VCIFIHEDLEFFSISLDKYCKEKDIEVCAIRLNIIPIKLIILAIYRCTCSSSKLESRTLDFRESKCLFRGPEILMETNSYT